MKSKIYTNLVAYCYKIQLKIVLSILFICSLSSISFGQSMYICMGEDGNSVYAAAYVSVDYMSSSHTNTTYVQISGPSGTASGSGSTSANTEVAIADGTFTAYAYFDSICPFTGESAGAGSGTAQTTVCVDTCTACKADRHSKQLLCIGASAACEAAATIVYNNAMTSCENNNFCNPNSPQYNQSQCDNCKGTANQNFAIATAACGSTFAFCYAALPNCADGIKKDVQCNLCTN